MKKRIRKKNIEEKGVGGEHGNKMKTINEEYIRRRHNKYLWFYRRFYHLSNLNEVDKRWRRKKEAENLFSKEIVRVESTPFPLPQ